MNFICSSLLMYSTGHDLFDNAEKHFRKHQTLAAAASAALPSLGQWLNIEMAQGYIIHHLLLHEQRFKKYY